MNRVANPEQMILFHQKRKLGIKENSGEGKPDTVRVDCKYVKKKKTTLNGQREMKHAARASVLRPVFLTS